MIFNLLRDPLHMPARLEDAWVRESDVQESVELFWEYPLDT
jgi:hypothetical protein